MILRHSPYALGAQHGYAAQPANNVVADDSALIEAYRAAGEHGVPVSVHQEAAFSGELERALDAAPETTFVWAHAGHGPPGVLRGMLARHPNLMCDLSARTPWLGPGTVLLLANGRVDPEWAATLADYADRAMLGLDLFVTPHFSSHYIGQTVAYYRGVLGQLDPDVARLIARDNAVRVLGPFTARDAMV
jgi:predicted TIM-barrel fold metal-dependent hydrolase